MNVAQLERLQELCDQMRAKISAIDIILSYYFPNLVSTLRALCSHSKELRKRIAEQEYISSNKELRSMYKRVAQRTHPDKDGGNADTFHRAKEAYEKGDAVALSKIANSVGLATKPSEELLVIQAQSLICEHKLLSSSPLLGMASLWETNNESSQESAKRMYQEYIQERITRERLEIKNLQKLLSEVENRQEPVADNGQKRLPQPVALLQTMPQAASG